MRIGTRNIWAGAVCLSALGFAEVAAAQQVSMPLRVRAGDEFTVTVLDRNSTTSPEGDQGVETTSVWELEVLSSAQPNARWRWTPVTLDIESISLEGGSDPVANAISQLDLQALSDAIGALIRITADIGFECRVDRTGRCIEMTNWPMWNARLENTVLLADAIARVGLAAMPGEPSAAERKRAFAEGRPAPTGGPSEGRAMWDQYRGPVMRAIASLLDGVDARAAASAMSGLYPLAAVQGRTLTVGRETQFTEEWTMPFGSPPVRVAGSVTLTAYDPGAGVATIERRSELDSESLKVAVRQAIAYAVEHVAAELNEVLGQQAVAMNPETFRALADMIISMFDVTFSETTRGTIDMRTGLARETVTDYRWGLDSLGGIPGMGPPATPTVRESEGEAKQEDPAEEPAADTPAPASTTVATGSGTMTIRVTRGAPAQPRLPRSAHGG